MQSLTRMAAALAIMGHAAPEPRYEAPQKRTPSGKDRSKIKAARRQKRKGKKR